MTDRLDYYRGLPERERDALLAERLGWVRAPIPPVEIARALAYGGPPNPGPWWIQAGDDPRTAIPQVPRYGSDPAAMKLVIGAMAKRFFGCRIYVYPDGETHAQIASAHSSNPTTNHVVAASMELAVALAALLATDPEAE